MAARWPTNIYIFLLLFDSIGGAVELALSRNKVHAKNRNISFSRNFCSAIYTYSTVYVYIYRPLIQKVNFWCLIRICMILILGAWRGPGSGSTHLYKVIVAEKEGDRAIGAFVVPNEPISAKHELKEYQVRIHCYVWDTAHSLISKPSFWESFGHANPQKLPLRTPKFSLE